MSHSTTRLVVTPASAGPRRSLRPIEWVVLEEIALDARVDARSDARTDGAGTLVAATSARRVAEHLGLTPGATAKALAALRTAGLVPHDRLVGPAGRFGLSMYTLTLPPGLEVIQADEMPVVAGQPVGGSPRPAPSHVESPRAVERHMVANPVEVIAPVTLPASGGRGGRVRSSSVGRRSVRQERVAQLSILDLTDDAGDATDRVPTPASTRVTTTATTTAQRPSARPANAVARPLNPSA